MYLKKEKKNGWEILHNSGIRCVYHPTSGRWDFKPNLSLLVCALYTKPQIPDCEERMVPVIKFLQITAVSHLWSGSFKSLEDKVLAILVHFCETSNSSKVTLS